MRGRHQYATVIVCGDTGSIFGDGRIKTGVDTFDNLELGRAATGGGSGHSGGRGGSHSQGRNTIQHG